MVTRRRLLQSTALVGSALALLGAGLAVALTPWFLGASLGGLLVLVGLASVVRSCTRLGASAAPDTPVGGPSPVLIAWLTALLAAAVPVIVHVKVGVWSSAGTVAVLVAACALVVVALAFAIRWSR